MGEPRVFNVHEAKTQLSKLLEMVDRGEEVILAKGGKPVARLVAIESRKPREPGVLEGVFEFSDSFFDPLPPEEMAAWEGGYEGDPLK